MADEKMMSIGELARRSGVATSALRYYERLGLLTPLKRVSQQRHFLATTVDQVALISLCRNAGFTLAEIACLLPATHDGHRTWSRLAEEKIAALDARIAHAQQAKHLLEHALGCPHEDLHTCPNFRDALESHLVDVS